MWNDVERHGETWSDAEGAKCWSSRRELKHFFGLHAQGTEAQPFGRQHMRHFKDHAVILLFLIETR